MAFDKNNPKNRKRRKVCQFCVDKATIIDYKDTAKLRRFISERSKIPAPHYRYLRNAPASAHRGYQESPSDRSPALRDRLIFK